MGYTAAERRQQMAYSMKELKPRTDFYRNYLALKDYQPGISVVIPTYKGADRILTCLNSLVNQTLSPLFFEVIIIINGEKDQTSEKIAALIESDKLEHFIVEYREEANVSLARNAGIDLATKEYIVFLDDDDYITANYLEKMYQYSAYDSIVVSQIYDMKADGTEVKDTLVNEQIVQAAELEEISLASLSHVLSMNACKAIPTYIAKQYHYDSKLTSGEDVVFFTELVTSHSLTYVVIPPENQVVYYRILRDDSISRQEMTFDFYVKQRLDVIRRLDDLLAKASDKQKKQFIRHKMNGQASFIRMYLAKYPDSRERVLEEITANKFADFPLESIELEVETESSTDNSD